MDGLSRMQRIIAMVVFSTLVLVAPTGSMSQERTIGAEIQLPAEDRTILEKVLGKGVVGKAVVGTTISDPLKFFLLEDATWVYRVTSGKRSVVGPY